MDIRHHHFRESPLEKESSYSGKILAAYTGRLLSPNINLAMQLRSLSAWL